MYRIVFLDRATLPVTIPSPALPQEWVDWAATAPAQVVERLQGAQVAISNKVPLIAESLQQLPGLKLIAVAATGTNNVDLDYCRDHGIAVCNVAGYSTHSVTEHVFAMMLELRRNLSAFHRDVSDGAWQAAPQFCLFSHPINDLHDSTLGIVGRGTLGSTVAQVAKAFGMRVLFAEHKDAADVRPGYTPFGQVLREADVLTLHCPLTPATRHLIGADELRQMKPTALLINAARGGIVDEAALAEALQSGRIGGAGVDVLSAEPPRDGNPLLQCAGLGNIVLTPHVAWTSQQSMQRLAAEIVANIEAFARGEARNRVA